MKNATGIGQIGHYIMIDTMKEKILKLLNSTNKEDVLVGIQLLLTLGYNKAKNISKELPETIYDDEWVKLGCNSGWGYYNSTRNSYRAIIANSELLVLYKPEKYVRDKLGWTNLEI